MLFLSVILISVGCTKTTTTTREVIVVPNGNGQTSSSARDDEFVQEVRTYSEEAKSENSATLISLGTGMCSVLNNNKGVTAVYRAISETAKGDTDAFTYYVTIFVVAVDVYCPQHQADLKEYNQNALK